MAKHNDAQGKALFFLFRDEREEGGVQDQSPRYELAQQHVWDEDLQPYFGCHRVEYVSQVVLPLVHRANFHRLDIDLQNLCDRRLLAEFEGHEGCCPLEGFQRMNYRYASEVPGFHFLHEARRDFRRRLGLRLSKFLVPQTILQIFQ
jgi:hypothetical protein